MRKGDLILIYLKMKEIGERKEMRKLSRKAAVLIESFPISISQAIQVDVVSILMRHPTIPRKRLGLSFCVPGFGLITV